MRLFKRLKKGVEVIVSVEYRLPLSTTVHDVVIGIPILDTQRTGHRTKNSGNRKNVNMIPLSLFAKMALGLTVKTRRFYSGGIFYRLTFNQFSTTNFGTRENSSKFAVAMISPCERACAAINKSLGPIGAPFFSSW